MMLKVGLVNGAGPADCCLVRYCVAVDFLGCRRCFRTRFAALPMLCRDEIAARRYKRSHGPRNRGAFSGGRKGWRMPWQGALHLMRPTTGIFQPHRVWILVWPSQDFSHRRVEKPIVPRTDTFGERCLVSGAAGKAKGLRGPCRVFFASARNTKLVDRHAFDHFTKKTVATGRDPVSKGTIEMIESAMRTAASARTPERSFGKVGAHCSSFVSKLAATRSSASSRPPAAINCSDTGKPSRFPQGMETVGNPQ